METLLLFLPTIFSFLSGILISWGIFVMYRLSTIIEESTGEIKSAQKWCIGCIAITTLMLASLLFFFTSFAAFHMSTILFLEIWYGIFLTRITFTPWNTPCKILVQKRNSAVGTLLHLHK